MGYLSNPIYGDNGLISKDEEGNTQYASGGDMATEWLTGKAAFDDVNGMEVTPITAVGFDTSIHFDPSLQGYGADWMSGFDWMANQVGVRKIDPLAYAMLLAQANGTAPSAAQLQLQAGLDRQQMMAQSLAASNPNISPALAQRLAGQQMADMTTQTNQQAAILRAQEQAQAQQAFAEYGLKQQSINDAMAQFYMQQGFSRDEAEMLAAKDAAAAELAARQAQAEQANQVAIANQQMEAKSKGGFIGAAGDFITGIAASDRRLKTEVQQSDDESMDGMLEALTGYKFRYKDERHGKGDNFGIMAQDLERSELGRSLVVEHPEGKMVDTRKASLAALALASHLARKIKRLEAKR